MATAVTNGHSSLTNGAVPGKGPISVKINGKIYEVDPAVVPAGTSLNSFLRNHANLTGTKFMCLEGGCGACIVTATGKDPVTKELHSWAINSCLTPIYACEDLEITTIEGIGNRKTGYHPVQKRLTQFHGTQCGYCSPGMVMNMYSLLEANDGNVTMKDIENSFGGNICRCTGYRPILDAFKSLASDADPKYKALCADIEEIPRKCPKTGESCNGSCHGGVAKSSHIAFSDGKDWFKPKDLDELINIWSKIGTRRYMLVAGNTAHGVYRVDRNIEVFIDINSISDLHSHVISPNEVKVGGNVSLTSAMQILTDAAKNTGYEYCAEIVKHIDLVANVPVRNAGTLAGNLAIKNTHLEFPSDIFICLLAAGAKLNIVSGSGKKETVSMSEFLKVDMNKKIILNIILQPYPAQKFLFRSYKIMPRAQNAHAYVNAAFLVELDSGRVKSSNICFGGINPSFTQAAKTEQYLLGKELFKQETLTNAIKTLQNEIQPDWELPDASPAFRTNLAVSLFYKFILATCPSFKLSNNLKSGGEVFDRPVSTAIQTFDTYKDKWPMTQPVEKNDGIVQTSGEAQYVNDIPNIPHQLWGAFVHATEVHATITKIDPTKALSMPGIRHFFSANDIPGQNNFTPTTVMLMHEPEEIFCSGSVKYHGQPIGIILADTFELANAAANMVEVEYKKSDKPILPTIVDVYANNAVERFHPSPLGITPTTEGTETKTLVKGRFEIGGQYHFTMEPQTCLCVPTEDCMDIYAATQWVDLAQIAIAQCLDVPQSSLNMQVRRLGGGYGGKISRASLIACACALGAKLTNRPVRLVLTLESNMATIGKRHGVVSDYEVYVDPKGKITKLTNDFAEDYGCSLNEDPIFSTVEFFRNCYYHDTWKVTAKSAITDSASNTWCRAPGTTEGIAMIENIMEHISRVTGLDPVDVRMANIPDDNKMKTLLPGFLESVEYKTRKYNIDKFNADNRWKKRGIAVVPMHYPQGFFGGIPVMVSIFHNDGTVAVTHGGVEMGQGINTKVIQVAAKTLNIPMDYIRVKPSLNSVTTNSTVTGGSMTSEAVCYGTVKACEKLLERIQPVRETMKDAKWPQITEACFDKLIELSATHFYKAPDVQSYSTWGLSCAEVEIDVLTGNLNLKRVDILEDTGESISPHVDMGQVEGAFIMGVGYWLTESLIYDKKGKLLTNRSWNYKPPGPKDIPIDFRVTFMRNSTNPLSVLRSKATGEPSLCMSIVVLFALRNAIEAARKDAGLKPEWINLGAPATVEKVFSLCGTNPESFKL